MTTPDPSENLPPHPITLEYLAGCIIGLNGRVDGLNSRIDSLEARVSTIESDVKDLRAGQRHILVALVTIGGAIIATLGGGMVAGIFALLSVLS